MILCQWNLNCRVHQIHWVNHKPHAYNIIDNLIKYSENNSNFKIISLYKNLFVNKNKKEEI